MGGGREKEEKKTNRGTRTPSIKLRQCFPRIETYQCLSIKEFSKSFKLDYVYVYLTGFLKPILNTFGASECHIVFASHLEGEID